MAAEAAVSFAVETLGNLLIEKAVFLQGVDWDVEWVRNELKRMQYFLKDAAKKQSDNDSIRNWISEIREVAYDAEDTIEKFVLNVENVRRSRGLLWRCACFPDHLNHLNNAGNEIESIRKRLKDIEESRSRYDIRDLGESSRSRSELEVESRRRVSYWQQDRDVVGLEKDVELLLDGAILEERGGLSVASIIGMGGIGKSTLARKIYNHPKITGGYFECRAWVVVSSEFTAEDIMKQILVQLGISLDRLKLLESVDDKLRRQQNLEEELHRYLTGKRYLIVVDDVWEATHWESLRTSFPHQGLVAQEVVGEEETMEDVATDYLNQLISRNMVQVKSFRKNVVKECQRKAKEEINLEILVREEGDSQHSLHKPRHRAIYSGLRLDSYTNQNQYLRSLFIIGDSGVPSSYWKSFELLRVLALDVRLKVLPKAIGALTGLRYIKMRYSGRTSKLPRSWGKLTNLQVLDLWGAGYVDIIIDKVILKMKSLRHLYAPISYRSKHVPLGNMKKLQTLSLFPLKDSSVWAMQGMAGATILGFEISEMSDASELFTHLASLGNLVSLNLRGCNSLVNMDGLSALHRITELKLQSYNEMKRLPINFPPKLSYLTLSGMDLIEDPMPVLERLSELLYLKLAHDIYKGEELVITRHGFPKLKLKVLHLGHMLVRNIQVEKGGMPELKHLFIHDCPHLDIENLPHHLKSATTDG